MRTMLHISINQFRLNLRLKGALFTMFGMPLLLTFLFGIAFNPGGGEDMNRFSVAVIDSDGTFASDRLVEALSAQPLLNITLASADEAATLLAHQKVSGVVTIPAGFEAAASRGKQTTAQLVTPPGSTADLAIHPAVLRAISQVSTDYRLAQNLSHLPIADGYAEVAEQRAALTIAINQEAARVSSGNNVAETNKNERAMGFTLVFIMAIAFTASGSFLKERQDGTWGRLLMAPVGRVSLICGYLLSFVLLGLFQFSILVLGTRFMFGIQWGPLLPLFVVGFAFILAAAGVGLFLAGVVKSLEQQRTLGTIVVQATAMLGGCYWPLDVVGESMQKIGYLTPQAWAMDGLREVMLRGAEWAAIALPLGVLLAMALTFTSVGVLRIRFD